MAEKRKTRRKRKRVPVTFSSHGLAFNGVACNFSYSGIFIRTMKPFKPGVPVEVSLHVDNDCEICVRGRSVRARNVGFVYNKNGMGIQLVSQSEEYRNFLKELFLMGKTLEVQSSHGCSNEIKLMEVWNNDAKVIG